MDTDGNLITDLCRLISQDASFNSCSDYADA